jgi:hypothetical protein
MIPTAPESDPSVATMSSRRRRSASTTFLAAIGIVVDGGPSPAMTGTAWPGSQTHRRLGDPGAGIDDAVGSLDGLLDLSARQEAEGLGEAPWPPHYPKPADEPPRVMPSRRRMTMPLIEIARAAEKDEALAGLARWSDRHPEAARHLEPDDVLVDAMRGRYTTWTRIRVNLRHVPEEELPLDLECVVKSALLRHLLPSFEEVDGLRDVGVPDRPRRGAVRLYPAMPQARHRAALGAIHLDGQQIVPPYAHAPRRVEMRDDPPCQLEGSIRGVVGRAFVFLVILIPPFRDMGRREAGD